MIRTDGVPTIAWVPGALDSPRRPVRSTDTLGVPQTRAQAERELREVLADLTNAIAGYDFTEDPDARAALRNAEVVLALTES